MLKWTGASIHEFEIRARGDLEGENDAIILSNI